MLVFAADTRNDLRGELRRLAPGWRRADDRADGARLLHSDHGAALPAPATGPSSADKESRARSGESPARRGPRKLHEAAAMMPVAMATTIPSPRRARPRRFSLA